MDATHTGDWRRVGDAIRRRMNELGINQAEVARRSGLSDHTARAFINGTPRGTPGNAVKAKLSTALGWTPDSIQQIHDGGEPQDATRRPSPAAEELRAALVELAEQVAAQSQQLEAVTRHISVLLDAADAREQQAADRLQRVDERLDQLTLDVRRVAARVLDSEPE